MVWFVRQRWSARPDRSDCLPPTTQEPDDEEQGKGAGDAFDFEAHMARLIERSERSLGFVAARGWEEGELEQLERVIFYFFFV